MIWLFFEEVHTCIHGFVVSRFCLGKFFVEISLTEDIHTLFKTSVVFNFLFISILSYLIQNVCDFFLKWIKISL